MKFKLLLAVTATLATCVIPAFAQDEEGVPGGDERQENATEASVLAGEAAVPLLSHLVVPALTPVSLEILTDVGSDTSNSGDSFPIRLAKPIIVDGHEVIPAGALGVGEVVHSKKRGGGGAGGELILAARYLEVGDRQLPLRSMSVAVIGLDQMEKAQMMTALVGVFGMSVKGRDVEVRKGRLADAKTAKDFELELDNPTQSETVPSETAAAAAETEIQ